MSVSSFKQSNKTPSIVSQKQPNKTPSVVSSVRNGKAGSTMSETIKSTTNTNSNVNGTSKPLPFNAVTVPSVSVKGRVLGDQELTEEELEHLADVCRRYEQLQRREDERIKQIRDKAISREKARRGVSRFDEAHCALCGAAFMAIINTKSLCLQCERYVCRNCVHHKIDNDGILCIECFNECSNKARTGLWFTEKLQVAKKDGRIITIAPTSALRASLTRKKREQSAASSVIGKPPPNPQKQNGNVTDTVQEAAKRLANSNDKDTNQRSNFNNQRQPLEENASIIHAGTSGRSSFRSRSGSVPRVTELRRRLSSSSSTTDNIQNIASSSLQRKTSKGNLKHESPTQIGIPSYSTNVPPLGILKRRISSDSPNPAPSLKRNLSTTLSIRDGTRRGMRVEKGEGPLISLTPANGAEQLAFNVIFSGVDNLPKTTSHSRSRQHSTSGHITPITLTGGNAGSISEGLNTSTWDNKSMLSSVSVGSVTSVYSEREESFTHGIRIKGDLNFSVDYEDKSGTLRIFVKQAREIAVADSKLNSSNTYVKAYLLPDKTKASKRKTKVKKNSTNPLYNESLIYEIARSDMAYRTLQLSVWHYRHAKANLFLGEVLVPLADYRFSSTPIWRALQNRNSLGGDGYHRLTKGQIRLGLMYVPQTEDQGELQIHIQNATDLNVPLGASGGGDNKNVVNPFVKTYLLPERPKESKRKTTVIKKTNNPTWGQTLVYNGIAKTQLPSIGVEVIIWDATKIGHHEYLGGCNLNAGSRSGYGMDATGTERSLWVEMMSKPNTLVEGNVPLRSTMD